MSNPLMGIMGGGSPLNNLQNMMNMLKNAGILVL